MNERHEYHGLFARDLAKKREIILLCRLTMSSWITGRPINGQLIEIIHFLLYYNYRAT